MLPPREPSLPSPALAAAAAGTAGAAAAGTAAAAAGGGQAYAPSSVKGRDVESIVLEWNSELEKHTQAFIKHASEPPHPTQPPTHPAGQPATCMPTHSSTLYHHASHTPPILHHSSHQTSRPPAHPAHPAIRCRDQISHPPGHQSATGAPAYPAPARLSSLSAGLPGVAAAPMSRLWRLPHAPLRWRWEGQCAPRACRRLHAAWTLFCLVSSGKYEDLPPSPHASRLGS
jgi:hypothetical protein